MVSVTAGLKRMLAGMAAAWLTVSPAAAAEREARPALWRIADADTTIYLFGTVHFLPPGLDWRTQTFDRALESADELVLETVFGEDPMVAGRLMMQLARSPGLPPLLQRVPAEKRPALQRLVERSGVPMTVLDQMESWAAAMSLMSVQLQDMGVQATSGVEEGLSASYRGSSKPIRGLNTPEEQFGFMDGLSAEAQQALLESVADDQTEARRHFEELLAAWKEGDVAEIAETFDDETLMSPELRRVLMSGRNRMWTDWLVRRMAQPGTVFVAVGAGHLAGQDSVQTLLAQRGLRAERVQ